MRKKYPQISSKDIFVWLPLKMYIATTMYLSPPPSLPGVPLSHW